MEVLSRYEASSLQRYLWKDISIISWLPLYIFIMITFNCISVSKSLNSNGFNFYYTDRYMSTLDHHCLYYAVPEKGLSYQFLPYCIRFPLSEPVSDVNEYHQSFTFDSLRQRSITSDQLFAWSAPIDIVERYQMYLNFGNLPSADKLLFYNCTYPWFGSHCEYHFDEPQASFSEQIEAYNKNKYTCRVNVETFPCYTHLKCDRIGGNREIPGACLDWREICDGKIDCVDGGRDEEYCWLLEMNECDSETEFRCHNGLCIPIAFLHDDVWNPDCLDKTDEPGFNKDSVSDTCLLPGTNCEFDDTFRCEESTCRPRKNTRYIISCGNGDFTDPFSRDCINGRSVMLLDATFLSLNLSDICRAAFYCLMDVRINSLSFFNVCDKHSIEEHAILVKEHCPPLMKRPPILFGHVHLVYTNDQIEKLKTYPHDEYIVHPDYICYNHTLCEHNMFYYESNPPIDLFQDGSICQPYGKNERPKLWYGTWSSILSVMDKAFRTCSSYHWSPLPLNLSRLHTCKNSSKRISQYRLNDLVDDCFYGDDELHLNNCSLNMTKYQFKCNVTEKLVCLAHVRLLDGCQDCPDGSDEVIPTEDSHRQTISFQTICNGFTELIPILIDGNYETDETECDRFPCNNSYTRCDGYWNCNDGADEVNCEWPPICPTLHHLCISSVTRNLTCLSKDRVNDEHSDCLGHTDERRFCASDIIEQTYRCWNTTQCINPHFVCLEAPFGCKNEEISKKLCADVFTDRNICSKRTTYNYIEQVLCSLDASVKVHAKYFSLVNVNIYKDKKNLDIETTTPIITTSTQTTQDNTVPINKSCIRLCENGIPIHRSIGNGNQSKLICLCPPAFYGDFCQYQNQRVSITVHMITLFEWRTVFALIITLFDDHNNSIQSYDQVQYVTAQDCNKKFNIYLLYKTRPKSLSVNYSIRFDVYNKHTLDYRASWLFPIRFPFLPVYRLPVQLYIPSNRTITERCEHIECGKHGHCSQYVNINTSFCLCDEGWSGKYCTIKHKCNCASGSVCLNSFGCLCPLTKLGPRCYMKHSSCPCKNGGICVMDDEHSVSQQNLFCICPEGFSGPMCETNNTRIEISFAQEISIPTFIFVHFIESFEYTTPPIKETILNKVQIDQDIAIVYKRNRFHVAFVEMEPKTYYLSYLEPRYIPRDSMSWKILPSKRCAPIAELFNQSFLSMHLLRRMKYYHIPCQNRTNLSCFYDERHMCICDPDLRQANCLEFDHNVTHNCKGRTICEHGGQCFLDSLKCPTSFVCVCAPCTYGSRCQFIRTKFDLSLDSILGYQIKPKRSFLEQPVAIKIVLGIVILMMVCGLVSGILSIRTFNIKTALQGGCGYYLLTSSYASIMLMILFGLNVILTITSHMALITNRYFLSVDCILSEYLIKILLNYVEWMNVCVGIERVIILTNDNTFNQNKRKKIAKNMVICIFIFIAVTHLPDPMHRQLIDDGKEQRLWCITEYGRNLQTLNTIVLFFHFLGPFTINIISAIIIIVKVAQYRAKMKREAVSREHLWIQILKFKHLLISPLVLIILAFPRLIIAFLLDCMKSSKDPWLFLAGYFIPFASPMLIFFIFMLSSSVYKTDLTSRLNTIKNFIRKR